MNDFQHVEIETMLFFAKEVVLSLREGKKYYSLIFDIGEKRYEEIIDFLVENNEVSEQERENLENLNIIFHYSLYDVMFIENIKLDIEQGTNHIHEINMDLLEKMLSSKLINKEDVTRYLAHKNNYHKVIEMVEEKKELLIIAKKYGSQKTRSNFLNYETMKNLEKNLPIKNTKNEKIIKI